LPLLHLWCAFTTPGRFQLPICKCICLEAGSAQLATNHIASSKWPATQFDLIWKSKTISWLQRVQTPLAIYDSSASLSRGLQGSPLWFVHHYPMHAWSDPNLCVHNCLLRCDILASCATILSNHVMEIYVCGLLLHVSGEHDGFLFWISGGWEFGQAVKWAISMLNSCGCLLRSHARQVVWHCCMGRMRTAAYGRRWLQWNGWS